MIRDMKTKVLIKPLFLTCGTEWAWRAPVTPAVSDFRCLSSSATCWLGLLIHVCPGWEFLVLSNTGRSIQLCQSPPGLAVPGHYIIHLSAFRQPFFPPRQDFN